MDSRHQALLDAEILMDDLCKGCQAICCARGVRDHGVVCRIEVGVVHSDNIDWDRILRRRRDDDSLGATLDMQLCLRFLGEDACGFTDILHACSTPWNGSGVLLVEDCDVLSIDYEEILTTFLLLSNGACEPLVHTVIFQLVNHVGEIHERLVDCCNLCFCVCRGSSKHETANTAK